MVLAEDLSFFFFILLKLNFTPEYTGTETKTREVELAEISNTETRGS